MTTSLTEDTKVYDALLQGAGLIVTITGRAHVVTLPYQVQATQIVDHHHEHARATAAKQQD